MADINNEALVGALYHRKSTLDSESTKAGHLVSLGPISVPNQFLGLDLRTKGQKAAQEDAHMFNDAMSGFLRELSKTMDKISAMQSTN